MADAPREAQRITEEKPVTKPTTRTPPGNKKRRLFRFLALALGLLIAAVLLVVVEVGSYLILKWRGAATHSLFRDSKNPVNKHPPVPVGNLYDPHLGYAYSASSAGLAGFEVYRRGTGTGKPLRILALGGSTTDPYMALRIAPHPLGQGDGSWPRQLADLCAERGMTVEVYNGGVGGYTSSQELIKLIRDGLPLKPDIVISLNGLNEDNIYFHDPAHPMVHQFQKDLLLKAASGSLGEFALMPNFVEVSSRVRRKLSPEPAIVGVNLGTTNKLTAPAEVWERNGRLMDAVTREFGARYLCCLQPWMGIAGYNPSPEEKAMLDSMGPYPVEVAAQFFDDAISRSGSLKYCINITDLFKGQTGLYRDPRHPNAEGNGLIAKAAFEELQKRGWIK